MPLKDYSTKAAYDSDYRLIWRTPQPLALPAATVTFSVKTMTPAPPWPQVAVGGEIRVSLGLVDGAPHPLNIIGRVADVADAAITLNIPREWPTTVQAVSAAGVLYAVPEVTVNYLSCVLRPGTYEIIDALIVALGMTPGQKVGVVGCGMGWELERLVDLGFTVMGVETSAFVAAEKGGSEAADVDAALTAAGYDPSRGEGARQRAAMLAEPRCKVPTLILNEDVNTGRGRNVVRSALGLSGAQKADWGISIGVMQTLTDAEASALNNNMVGICANVAHYITVLPEVENSIWNKKSAEDWKALLTPALIVPHGVAAQGYRVL
ncbi:MAG TPA: hypothetical protein VF987_05270 [Rhodospirillales bacterium]